MTRIMQELIDKYWKIALIILFLMVSVWSGYEMSTNFFWGHLPLFLFLSIWMLLQLLLWNKYERSDKSKRWWLMATVGGAFLSIGFPPSFLLPFIFIGFVPFLKMEQEISDAFPGTSKWRIFKLTYHGLLLWNILTTYWVTNTAFLAGLFAIFVNALLMTIPFMAYHVVKKKLAPRLALPSFIAFWISFEYFHLNWELSWPWLTLGNTFAKFPSWVQWYEYTGVFGGTLWILAVSMMLFVIWHKAESLKRIKSKALIRPVLIVLVPIIVSVCWYYSYEEKGLKRTVAVVQPNYNPHSEKFEVPFEDQLDRFIQLSDDIVDSSTNYLLFPETSFQGDHSTLNNNVHVRKIRQFMRQHPDLICITGINGYAFVDDSLKHASTSRPYVSRGDTSYWESYNSAIQLSNDISDIPVYLKSKLVPGPENFPYHQLFFFMKGMVNQLGGTTAGLKTQKQRSVFTSQHGRVAPVICYESIYGEFCTGYIRKGAQAIFIVTNDGWWDNTGGHKQHLMFASLRAIECRRSIARSANTGISGYINQRGDRFGLTEYEVADAIQNEVYMNDSITFYVKWGDIIARIAIFTSIILFLNALVKHVTSKKAKAEE